MAAPTTDLKVRGVLNKVTSAVPLDRRRRVSNDAAVKPNHLALAALDVLEQLREFRRHDVARDRRRTGVAQFTQRCRNQNRHKKLHSLPHRLYSVRLL